MCNNLCILKLGLHIKGESFITFHLWLILMCSQTQFAYIGARKAKVKQAAPFLLILRIQTGI